MVVRAPPGPKVASVLLEFIVELYGGGWESGEHVIKRGLSSLTKEAVEGAESRGAAVDRRLVHGPPRRKVSICSRPYLGFRCPTLLRNRGRCRTPPIPSIADSFAVRGAGGRSLTWETARGVPWQRPRVVEKPADRQRILRVQMQDLHRGSPYVQAFRDEEGRCWANAGYVDEA